MSKANSPTHKVCCKCSRAHSPEVPFEKNSRGGLRPWCKECYQVYDLALRRTRKHRRKQETLRAQIVGTNPFEWRTYAQPFQMPIQTENEIYNPYRPLPVLRD